MEGPPDLCVEILSPSSVTIDKVDKFEQYEAAGVAYYWIIDPEYRTADAFQLTVGKYSPVSHGANTDTVSFPPFPDLQLSLARIWHPPLTQ